MQHSKRESHHGVAAALARRAALSVAIFLVASIPASAQNRPPLLEPVALEGGMKQFYRGTKVIIVTTADGLEHVYRFTKDLIVHGGRKPGVDALEDLREGTTVVIHRGVSDTDPTAEEIDLPGGEGLKIAEGVVTKIDRRRQEITIRYNNGTTETLQMTNRAAAESEAGVGEPGEETTRIVVYYSDDTGQKVAHYFKKAS